LAAPRASRIATRLLLATIVAIALWAHLFGLRGDLPFAYASDEGEFAIMAIRMAAEGDPNPRWFGHPGSTFLYPLAGLFRVAGSLDAGHSPLVPDPGLARRIGGDPGRYLWLGRLIAAFYAIASLPLVFLIARRAYDDATAVVATWLALLSPLALEYAQMLRTDSAGVFFGLLALWLCLRVLERPSIAAHAAAGLALGAAIGTRYLLASFVPVLLAADGILLYRNELPHTRQRIVRRALLALACVALGFALTTPFFFLDFATVQQNLAHEARTEHLGADGFGFAGNLHWYLTNALPESMPWTELTLAAAGLLLALWRRNTAALLVALAVTAFLLAISAGTLHWQRWLIQLLPLLAILAAGALSAIAAAIAGRIARPGAAAALLGALALALSAAPALAYVRFAVTQATPSTRIAARQWMIANLPPGSHVVADFYTAPLHHSELQADYHFALAEDGSLADYERQHYDYLMVSDAIYGRYQREPGRYPRQVAFYATVFRTLHPVARFTPNDVGRGPLITVFELRAAEH
jgi:4-amino-4-deoxy-L-arabinose transferase-like glycosyltransferase